MRNRSIVISILLAILVSPVLALETPRIIPRSERVEHPIDQVFGTLKHYFNDSSLSGFRLTSADDKSWTLIATRSGIDGENWKRWAFCKTSAQQMIYQFEDGTVTVTVQLQKAGNESAFVSVSADFQGNYGLRGQETTIDCVSNGSLEQDLITVAGGPSKESH